MNLKSYHKSVFYEFKNEINKQIKNELLLNIYLYFILFSK
jgi:hypothetical protein